MVRGSADCLPSVMKNSTFSFGVISEDLFAGDIKDA
jgi:hypothetical protein